MAETASSRGRALPRKRPDDQVLLAMIRDAALGQCGICQAPLLGWWGWCPNCGSEIQWTEPAHAEHPPAIIR